MTYGVSLRVFGFYHTGVMGQFIDKAFTIVELPVPSCLVPNPKPLPPPELFLEKWQL